MTSQELLDETRCIIDDTALPYGWSDLRLLNWLAKGQDEFCRKTGFWADRTTFTITTVLGQLDYPLDSRIIEVKSVWDGVTKLTRYKEDDRPTGVTQDVQRPMFYQTDGETNVLSLIAPPSEAGIVLTLRAHRKAILPITEINAPEIPEEFQLALPEYAAYRAFGDHDRELQDPVKSADHLNNFMRYVREGGAALRRRSDSNTEVDANPLYVV